MVEAGLKVTVTPAGAPELVRSTAPEKFVRSMAAVALPFPPCATVSAAGAILSAMAPGAWVTVSVRMAVALTPDPVPWIVTEWSPVATDGPTVSVTAAVVPVTLAGEKETITPAGAPLAVRITAPVNEPVRAIVTTTPPDAPCSTVTAVGATSNESPGGASTVRCTVAVCAVSPGAVPRTVRVALLATAPDDAVSVITPDADADSTTSGDAVMPPGRPSIDTVTAPSNPPERTTEIVRVVEVVLPSAASTRSRAAGAARVRGSRGLQRHHVRTDRERE